MEPRSIEPGEIRVGDQVRAEANQTTVVGYVSGFDGFHIIIGSITALERGLWSWTLLDRPEPPREVGSRWRDPLTGAKYVKTDSPVPNGITYICYAESQSASSRDRSFRAAELHADDDAKQIARLVPLDGDR